MGRSPDWVSVPSKLQGRVVGNTTKATLLAALHSVLQWARGVENQTQFISDILGCLDVPLKLFHSSRGASI